MRNNILGAVVYLSTAIVFGGSTALLMLFIKENSDRCHLASVYAPNPMEVTYWIDLSEDANGNVIKTYDGKKWIPINNKEDNTQNSQIEHLLNIINEKANKKDVYTIA